MLNIKAILWDYGNVLLQWSPHHFYKNIIKDKDRLDYFLNNICSMEWHFKNDLGQGMDLNIKSRQVEFPEFHNEIGMWKTNFGDMIIGEISPNIEIVKQLHRQSFPQFVLTNMPAEVFDICFEPYNLKQYFKDIIVSGAEKMAKPDKAIFDLTLKRMGGLKPQEVFFIDDNVDNINCAKNMGFVTHLFKNDETLANHFKELGILNDL